MKVYNDKGQLIQDISLNGHNVNELADITSAGADIEDAVTKRHNQQHSISSTSDHTSTITSGKIIKADANGLPTEGTNTDTDVADAVTKKHSQNTDHIIKDADADTSIDVEESADSDTLVGKVAGIEVLRAHTSGIVDLPKQSGCVGYLNTIQSIPATTYTKVLFDTEEFDTQNEFDSSTNYRFTVTKAGKYLIHASLQVALLADGDYGIPVIYINGAMHRQVYDNAGHTYNKGLQITMIENLIAGDYIEIYIYLGSDYNLTAQQYATYFSIQKIG